MTRTLATAAAVLAALWAAAPAAAKGVGAADVCGADGCREVEDVSSIAAAFENGYPTSAPERVPEWYRIDITIHGGGASDRFSVGVVPDERLLKGADGGPWTRIPPAAAAEIVELTRGLEPLPQSRLEGYEPVSAPSPAAPEPVAPSADGGGMPTWLVAGIGGVLLLLATLAIRLGIRSAAWRTRRLSNGLKRTG